MSTDKFCAVKSLLAFWILLISSAKVWGATAPVQPQELQGDIRQVHDPTIIKDGDTYYLFSTRAGIAIRCSKDLINWRLCGDVFAHLPQWAVKDVQGAQRSMGAGRVLL